MSVHLWYVLYEKRFLSIPPIRVFPHAKPHRHSNANVVHSSYRMTIYRSISADPLSL